LKKGDLNLLDLADICPVLFKREAVDEELFNVVQDIFRPMILNVEYAIVHKLLTNASTLLNKGIMPDSFFHTMLTSLRILSSKRKLKGRFVEELRDDASKINNP